MSEHEPPKGLELEPMEETRAPGRSRRGLWLAALAALLAALAAGVWLYLDLNRAPETVQAPASAQRDYMTEIPARPAAPETAPAPAQPEAQAPAAPAPGPKGDEVLTPDFVTDLAEFAASAYHPARTRHNDAKAGMTTLGFKTLNMRYGTGLTGLRHEAQEPSLAREEIFSALLHPLVMRLVFDLYAKDFTLALGRAARARTWDFAAGSGFQARPLSEAQVAEMYRLTAGRTRAMGRVFEAFARRPDLAEGMERVLAAARRVNQAYGAYADMEAAGAGGKALETSAEAIKQAIMERERLRQAVLGGLRAKDSGLSDGEVMDIAAWIARRLQGHADRIHSMGAIASLAAELADMLEAAPTG